MVRNKQDSMKLLILVGGGGHCKSVIDVAESAGYTILGILDMPEMVGASVLGYPVLGTDDDIPNYVDKAEFIITVGHIKNNTVRKKIAMRIENAGGKLTTIVASDAYVSRYATLGEGTVIMHKAFVNADAKVGQNCIINTMANIEHDAVIGDFCHISTGVMVNGGANIGNDTFVGSQSIVNQGVKIKMGGVISSLSVVNKDITEKGLYAGSPAKLIKPL